MEKFGIFELLDALSAITAAAGTEDKDAQTDKAYLPPSYGESAPSAPAAPSAERDALQSFLARHDAIAKKADRKKDPSQSLTEKPR